MIEVCDVGSATPFGVAPSADLRTDVPRYAIYRDGKLDQEVTDVTGCWPKDSVAFLIGCSFSYDGELMNAGIPLKSASQGKNVPMYRTNLKCRPAGCLRGNMVVSMKPIPALQVSKHVSYQQQQQEKSENNITILLLAIMLILGALVIDNIYLINSNEHSLTCTKLFPIFLFNLVHL